MFFSWFLSLFRDDLDYRCGRLAHGDHFLLFLMKLQLGLLYKDLAFRFNISEQAVSRIFRHWVPLISKSVKFLIVWPEQGVIKRNLPSCFKKKFSSCTCIIDCTEIFIERPLDLHARAQTWSNCKHTNSIKYLTGITPAGAVSFLSPGWGGRTSDKKRTLESEFLDQLHHGDCILVDRGFTSEAELATRGAILRIARFTRAKSKCQQRMLTAQE